MKDLRVVTHADAFEFAASNDLMYVESSAKDNSSVGYAFQVRKVLGEKGVLTAEEEEIYKENMTETYSTPF